MVWLLQVKQPSTTDMKITEVLPLGGVDIAGKRLILVDGMQLENAEGLDVEYPSVYLKI